jgi:hypothetical protein
LILDDELRRILGTTVCEVLQFHCSGCRRLCTWARCGKYIVPVADCSCDYASVKAHVESAEGWEPYPPLPEAK